LSRTVLHSNESYSSHTQGAGCAVGDAGGLGPVLELQGAVSGGGDLAGFIKIAKLVDRVSGVSILPLHPIDRLGGVVFQAIQLHLDIKRGDGGSGDAVLDAQDGAEGF